MPVNATEGTIPFPGHETWYRIVGDGEAPGRLPLLLLHGGPGAPHDYLESLERVAETGRRAIFYDQLGCGKSSRTDESLWNVETFVESRRCPRRTRAQPDAPVRLVVGG